VYSEDGKLWGWVIGSGVEQSAQPCSGRPMGHSLAAAWGRQLLSLALSPWKDQARQTGQQQHAGAPQVKGGPCQLCSKELPSPAECSGEESPNLASLKAWGHDSSKGTHSFLAA
jgi:hypothetical protein